MLTNQDLIYFLTKWNTKEADVIIRKLLTSSSFKGEAISYLNSLRSIDIVNFYEHLRKSYNEKHSSLYINLMREELSLDEQIITLASYILQANIYLKKSINKPLFIRESSLLDASRALELYYSQEDFLWVSKQLSKIKEDIKLYESFYRGGK